MIIRKTSLTLIGVMGRCMFFSSTVAAAYEHIHNIYVHRRVDSDLTQCLIMLQCVLPHNKFYDNYTDYSFDPLVD